MTYKKNIKLKSELSQIELLYDELEEFAFEAGFDELLLYNVHLVMEELTTNIIKYAYPDSEDHIIEINIKADRRKITIEIIDDGIEFNPLESKTPDIDADIEDREVGGLGLFFVKTMTDTIKYNRIGEQNNLTLTLKIKN